MKVLYLHSLRQVTGCSEEEIDESPPDVASLLALLLARHPALRAHERALRVARNHEWVELEARLTPEDEVAVMPPLSGG